MYAQGETHHPAFVAPGSFITAVTVQIYRLRDGAFLDWADGQFKTGGWTTKAQAMTAATDNLWVLPAGWTIPVGFDAYRVLFKSQSGDGYDGGTIAATHRRSATAQAGATATAIGTDLTETATDFWAGAFATFTTGALAGQVRKITGYNGASKTITTDPFTGAPAGGDRFIIVNH